MKKENLRYTKIENSKYADIKYSKELFNLFPNADWWWFDAPKRSKKDYKGKEIPLNDRIIPFPLSIKYGCFRCRPYSEDKLYPAITIQMALDALPVECIGILHSEGIWIVEQVECKNVRTENSSLPNALCEMIILLNKLN